MDDLGCETYEEEKNKKRRTAGKQKSHKIKNILISVRTYSQTCLSEGVYYLPGLHYITLSHTPWLRTCSQDIHKLLSKWQHIKNLLALDPGVSLQWGSDMLGRIILMYVCALLLQQLSNWLITQKLLPVSGTVGCFLSPSAKLHNSRSWGTFSKKKPLDSSVLFLVGFTAWGCLLGVAVDTAHFLNLKMILDLSELLMGQNRRLGLKRSVCLMFSPTFHPADNSYELLFCSCTVYGSFLYGKLTFITEQKGAEVQSFDKHTHYWLLWQVTFKPL